MLKNKIILVTGGLGAIGSNLVNKLYKDNEVIVLDNLTSGAINNIDVSNNIKVYKNDIRDLEILNFIFSTYNIDIVFHLAANFANQNSVDNPLLDCEVNALGTIKLLKLSNQYSIKKFIYASSSGVYGSSIAEMTEEKIGDLETPYYIHKLVGEQYCKYYYSQFGLKTVNLRIFNSYGEGELWGEYRNVIPNFFYRAMNDKSLVITGTGEETRDFTFVDDIVDGFIRGAYYDDAVGQVINIGSAKKTKIIDLANKINKLTNNNKPIIFKERRYWDNVTHRLAVNTKAKKLLKWEPKVEIDQGLSKYFIWLKDKL